MIESRPASFLLLITCCCFTACSSPAHHKSEVQGLIARDTFVQVLTEVHLVEGVKKQRLMRNDEQGLIVLQHYAEIFERFDISEDRFKTTYRWWYQHPEAMDGLLKEVGDRLSDLEREVNATN